MASILVEAGPQPNESPWRGETWLISILIIIALSARCSLLHQSVWMDEAWVANSVLELTLKDTFFYDRWMQTTPPGLLVLMRAAVALGGASELSLRAIPLLGGVFAVVVFGVVLRKMFCFPLAFLGTTFLAVNYWAVKYSAQIKSYGTDMLLACMLLYLLWNSLNAKEMPRAFLLTVLAAGVALYVSFALVFWFPTILLSYLLLAQRRDGSPEVLKTRVVHCAAACIFLVLNMALLHFLFVAPNSALGVRAPWRGYTLASGPFFVAFLDFLRNITQLLFPQTFSWARAFSYLLVVLAGWGACRAAVRGLRGDRRAGILVWVCCLPLLSVACASFLGYPVRGFPRLIIWLLPGLTLLLVYAVEPVWLYIDAALSPTSSRRVARILVPVLCFFAAFGSVLIAWKSKPHEDVRSAMYLLRDQGAAQSVIYVHSGMVEQFELYRRLMTWSPADVRLGNAQRPCCSRGGGNSGLALEATSLEADLQSATARSEAKKVWLLLPRASPGHWSYGLRGPIGSVPHLMQANGCSQTSRSEFENVLVLLFNCSSPTRAALSQPPLAFR